MISEYSPLSVFKYCPKCGNHGMAFHTDKSLKCNKCGFCYFFNMSAAVAAIIRNDKNEILFTIRKHQPAQGTLDLPGGFVDLGETAENALAREIFEELNLKIKSFNFEGSFTNKYLFKEIEYQTLDLVFNCTVETFDTLQAADDVLDYVFRDPSSVNPDEIGLDSIKEIVSKINGSRNGNHLLK